MTYVFDSTLNRRKFIGASGATAGVAAVGLAGCSASFGSKEHALIGDPAGQSQWGREAGEWIPTCCNMCGGQSGILVHVVDGVVEKIEPNHWNPNNYSNLSTDFMDGYTREYGCKEGGAICPKGNAGIMQLYDPDRVKRPLKRTNPDRTPGADPRWQEISWDQALDEIAAKLRGLRDAGEAHKLLWISEDHSFTHVQGDFCEHFGTPNYGMHANLCDTARKASFKSVAGDERPLADFLQSKYIMLWGWNPTSAIKWVYLPRIITRAIERGARLVVVDPYLSDTAAKAHEWVSIRPSTDGAMALAMGHVIVRDGLYDRDFVSKWSVGFDEYAEFVKDKTPAWAEKITSVPAATIERLAREVATTKPACIDVWSGPGQHSNAVQGGRAIAALSALVGGFDRPGTLILPEKKGNQHAHVHPDATAKTTLAQKRFDELHLFPFPHKSGVYARMFSNLANDKGPYKPKVLFNVFQNPMMAVPGTETVAKALSKLEMLVVIDTMLSETAMMADYVLPGTTYFERYDLNTHWVTWPALGLRQPVVKPLFGQPTEYEFVTELGRRLNLKDDHGNPFFEIGPLSKQPIKDLTAWYEDYLSNELKLGEPKMTLDELKRLPGAVWVGSGGTRYEKFARPVAAAKLEKAWFSKPVAADGKHSEGTQIFDKPKAEGGKRIGTIIGGQALTGFMTSSGKVEFVAKSLEGKKDADGAPVDPKPVYTQRNDYPDSEYPLFLINWKEASHTHCRTQNNPWLLELRSEAPLIIHPDTARRHAVSDGDNVWVESRYGKVAAKIQVSQRIHPEVVGLQHGFGHTALGVNAKGRGTSDAALRPCVADPLAGQSLHKQTAVRIRKV